MLDSEHGECLSLKRDDNSVAAKSAHEKGWQDGSPSSTPEQSVGNFSFANISMLDHKCFVKGTTMTNQHHEGVVEQKAGSPTLLLADNPPTINFSPLASPLGRGQSPRRYKPEHKGSFDRTQLPRSAQPIPASPVTNNDEEHEISCCDQLSIMSKESVVPALQCMHEEQVL